MRKKKFRPSLAKRKLHILWSYAVRVRDGYVCQWCKHDGKIRADKRNHAHHIVARSLCGNNGAFDVDNGMTLCYHCHIDRLKAEPDEYIRFRDSWLSVDYQDLRDKFRPVVKFTEEFYELKRESINFVIG